MQLPRQIAIQKATGPVTKNKASVNLFLSPEKKLTQQSWTSAAKPNLYKRITSGKGTVLNGNSMNRTSQNFSVTNRNVYNPYSSQGVHLANFNDQDFTRNIRNSRFRLSGENDSVNRAS